MIHYKPCSGVARVLIAINVVLLTSACVSIPENSLSLAAASAEREQVAIIRGHNLLKVNSRPIPRDVGSVILEPGTYKVHYGNRQYTYSVILKAGPGRTYLLSNESETSNRSRFEFKDVTGDPALHVTDIQTK